MGCPDYPEALAARGDAVRLARRWLGGRGDDAEDIVQEVYLTLYETRPARATRSYVLTRVHWRCIDALRRGGRRAWSPLQPWLPSGADTEREVVGRGEAQDALAVALPVLARLPHGRLVLASAVGYSTEELAAQQGRTVRQVSLSMNRARRLLRAEVSGAGQETRRASAERQRRYRRHHWQRRGKAAA